MTLIRKIRRVKYYEQTYELIEELEGIKNLEFVCIDTIAVVLAHR